MKGRQVIPKALEGWRGARENAAYVLYVFPLDSLSKGTVPFDTCFGSTLNVQRNKLVTDYLIIRCNCVTCHKYSIMYYVLGMSPMKIA